MTFDVPGLWIPIHTKNNMSAFNLICWHLNSCLISSTKWESAKWKWQILKSITRWTNTFHTTFVYQYFPGPPTEPAGATAYSPAEHQSLNGLNTTQQDIILRWTDPIDDRGADLTHYNIYGKNNYSERWALLESCKKLLLFSIRR